MNTEPVALKVVKGEICYLSDEDDQSYGFWCPISYDTEHGYLEGTKFYTHPAELTDEEIDEVVRRWFGNSRYDFSANTWRQFSRAILLKAQEK